MKKILLVIAVFSFGLIHAQQKDVFDIQKYLEKKSADDKNAIINSPYVLKPLAGTNNQTVWFVENGNTVTILPQDNMPCIVPDMSQYNMPVVKATIQPYNIPNPAYPSPGKIESSPGEQLKKIQELINKPAK
jgi:hypothetical protein